MRKIVFIVLAVLVAALVALFCWREFVFPDINFVSDYPTTRKENQFKVQRLYAADVDFDAFKEALEEITKTTEYTEEEVYAAAIASGTPEFSPAFNLAVNRAAEETQLDGFVSIEVAEGQTEQRFKMEKVSFEVVVTGDVSVKSIEVASVDEDNAESVVKVNTQQQAAVDITDAKSFKILLDGNDGGVTLKFVYRIQTDSFMPKTALEEQYLEVHAFIKPGAGDNLEVEYVAEPYSDLEQVSEQQAEQQA